MSGSLTLLVVEDNPGDARLVRELLRPFARARLEHVGSLAAALERLERGGVDAILLDLGLPDAVGTEAIDRVRDRFPDVPTLVLTGQADLQVPLQAMSTVAQDYLVKGRFDSDGLWRAVRSSIERLRAQNKLEHLSRVLRSVRKLNQRIVRERDPHRLIEHACQTLVEEHGYTMAWIVLADGTTHVCRTAGSNRHETLPAFEAEPHQGAFPACRSHLTHSNDVAIFEPTTCAGCPLSDALAGQQAVVALLHRGDVTYGLLGVRLPGHVLADEAELDLVRETAGDVAYANHAVRAEAATDQAEQRYRQLFERMSSGVAVYDVVDEGRDFRFADLNAAGERICGTPRRDLLGRRVSEVFPSVGQMGLVEILRAVSQDGKPRRHEEGLYQDDRLGFWADNRVFRLPDGRVVALFDDITERHELREERERLLARSQALLFAARAVLVEDDFDVAARRIFEACREVVGASAGYVATRTDDDQNQVHFLEDGGRECTVDESLRMPIRGLRAEAYRVGHAVFENDFVRSEHMAHMPAGHVRLDNVLFAPMMLTGEARGLLGLANKPGGFCDEDGQTAMAFAEFMAIAFKTAQARGELQRSEETFRTIFDSINDMVMVLDADTALPVEINARVEERFGWQRSELLGSRPPWSTEPAYDADSWSARVARAAAGEAQHFDWRCRSHRGAEFWTDVALSRASIHGASRVLAVMHDVTERRLAQEEIMLLYQELEQRVEEQTAELRASNAELEAFAYSVSHDLRAPLRAIDGFSQALAEDCAGGLSETAHAHLSRIRASAVRMGLLIDELLKLSRLSRAVMRRETVDLGAIAVEVVTELKEAEPDRSVEVRVGDELTAHADPTLLRAVMQNLIANAWKFTRVRSAARIEVGSTVADTQTAYFVSDNGVGFDMRYAGKLFTAFQRLHSPRDFEGTGIGLATVERVIRRHGGRVWVESEEGKGARFYFTLGAKP